MRKKTILVITDGIGYSEQKEYNAFLAAKKPTYDYLFANVPYSLVKTHGLSVGLPEGQMGNSEVGHMSIGSGRILYQDLVKVSLALKDGSLAAHPKLKTLFDGSNDIHIAGLVSDGGVHSHIEHIIGLAQIAKKAGKKVWLHAITDGRDVSPTSSKGFIAQLLAICDEQIKLATIGGRFYAMDRDNRWDRVERAYNAITNGAPKASVPVLDYINAQYKANITDEFLEPTAFDGFEGIKDGDGFVFANFRSDRAREIVTALGREDFSGFERAYKKINIVTMTEYSKEFNYPVLFEKDEPKNTLAEVISKAGLSQFHTAETEKYAHVTFFFNGGVETPYENETRALIPSPKVKTYDEKPEMSAYEVCDAVLKAMDEEYAFVVVNFANGDMVGHTGVFEAGIKAVEAVDSCLGRIVERAKQKDYALVLTSDHGNCEEMRDKEGHTLTNHTVGSVFCFVMDEAVKEVKEGGLNNIAPTILKLMGIDAPSEMDEALIQF
ncbi:MAG: 2,3-bisphosphoglycerate-independent phosphoglycerate mutase [Campylobacterales bacterium]|nr:2,3-bisphosphoglycerate-independent phosphoglycerate mutase [Campylobacterales bacterium]